MPISAFGSQEAKPQLVKMTAEVTIARLLVTHMRLPGPAFQCTVLTRGDPPSLFRADPSGEGVSTRAMEDHRATHLTITILCARPNLADSLHVSAERVGSMSERIFVVTHNTILRKTRVELLTNGGYSTDSVESAEEAMAKLATERFKVVVIGRRSYLQGLTIDQEIRERYPGQIILQIEDGSEHSSYVSRMVKSNPSQLLAAVRELLVS